MPLSAQHGSPPFEFKLDAGWLDEWIVQQGPSLQEEGIRLLVLVDDGFANAFPGTVSLLRGATISDGDLRVVRGGERLKCVSSLLRILRWLDERETPRRSARLWIVGGGALTDVGSLAATLYRRGIGYVRFPTTPLGAVDAGVAYKSAINFYGRKNLVGSFSSPLSVLVDCSFFASVPRRHIASGLAEVVKIGVALDDRVFSSLESLGVGMLDRKLQGPGDVSCIALASQLMQRHLQKDPLEKAGSSVTDLGHCLSRYLEQVMRPRLTHGEAVAAEIDFVTRYSRELGLISDQQAERIFSLFATLELPNWSSIGVSPKVFADALADGLSHRDGDRSLYAPTSSGVLSVPAKVGLLTSLVSRLSVH